MSRLGWSIGRRGATERRRARRTRRCTLSPAEHVRVLLHRRAAGTHGPDRPATPAWPRLYTRAHPPPVCFESARKLFVARACFEGLGHGQRERGQRPAGSRTPGGEARGFAGSSSSSARLVLQAGDRIRPDHGHSRHGTYTLVPCFPRPFAAYARAGKMLRDRFTSETVWWE